MLTILRIYKFNIYIDIYVNAEITNICLFSKYEVLHEESNIALTAKMVQQNNVLLIVVWCGMMWCDVA